MNLEALVRYLEDEGYGKAGREDGFFVHHMPERIKRGVLFLNPLFGMNMTPDLPGYRKSTFQMIVRGYNSYDEGLKRAWDLHRALSIQERFDLSDGTKVQFIYPRQDPIVFPFSKGDNLEIAVNFDAAYSLCNESC